jgi:alpha-L-rhamnosidase
MLEKIIRLLIIFISFAFINKSFAADQGEIVPQKLRVEYLKNPVIDEMLPRLSWVLTSNENDQAQTAYQIGVASSIQKLNGNKFDVWNTGKVLSNQNIQIYYKGKKLKSRGVYYWKVKVWDKNGIPGPWSKSAFWTMGLLSKSEWKAEWIGLDLYNQNREPQLILPPAPYLRKSFTLNKAIKVAQVYVTALGLYELYINGQRIGKDYFTPGWTDYNKRVYYQVYDVKSYLTKGTNVVGAVLSYGWYAGYVGPGLFVGLRKVRAFYGKIPKLKVQIEITFTDGSKKIIISDRTWKGSDGPLRESDIQMGDTYDARLELIGWDKPGYDDSSWRKVEVFPDNPKRKIEVYPGVPVRINREITPVSISSLPGGKYIFNMGQNFAGVVRLKVKGKRGQKIVIRYGEMLHKDGTLMTENLRKARATDTYILKGDPNGETWVPNFTYHGFQYVEVTGLSEKPTDSTITGLQIGSRMSTTGEFETSDPEVNRLYQNIVWTQLSNMLEVPTDCPQRDERLGYSGDAQIFIGSAVMNLNVAAFFKKWLVDLNDDQNKNGLYPDYAPAPLSWGDRYPYHPGWMEGGIIIPFTLYQTYGDIKNLEKFYPQMKKLVDYGYKKTKGKCYYDEGEWAEYGKGHLGLGDWLSIGPTTADDIIASIYLGYSIKLMKEISEVLGYKSDVKYYSNLFRKFQFGFIHHYINAGGKVVINEHKYDFYPKYKKAEGISGDTQTTYANLIYMSLLPDSLEKKAAKHLVELINKNKGKLTTGFLGVKQLLPALSETGHDDLAEKIFLNKEYPGWLYEVENGATSIWEHWDSYSKKAGFASSEMNSFDHYVFGSVCEWMFHNLAGIQNNGVAYDSILLNPYIDNHFSCVKAAYESVHGEILSYWKKDGDKIIYQTKIPVGVKARIFIPSQKDKLPEVNGQSLSKYKSMKLIGYKDGKWIVETPSGNYTFSSLIDSQPLKKGIKRKNR